jgi:predicted enzyme related to lactoylglutathione lyase
MEAAMSNSWPHGLFCWVEHATADLTAAKDFYDRVVGLKTKEVPMPGEAPGNYTMWTLDGERDVGGAHVLGDEEKQHGVPPHWLPYVSVDDIEATAAKAKQLGGEVMVEPFEIPNTGKMAVLVDPTGANVALWQYTGGHGGAWRQPDGEEPQLGMVCWTELLTTDAAKAEAFYTGLLGWSAESKPMGESPYTIFRAGETMAAGMIAIREDWGPVPSHWLNYFMVEDADAASAKVVELGGKQSGPAMDIPQMGRFAMVMDPQGAAFAVFAAPKG